jgi:hypothetical protein
MDEETPKPTIDVHSPYLKRVDIYRKMIPAYDSKDRAKLYRTMRKFRTKQMLLLGDESIEDPDPFDPSYIFYCFTGIREE